jgi:hypothetical protein
MMSTLEALNRYIMAEGFKINYEWGFVIADRHPGLALLKIMAQGDKLVTSRPDLFVVENDNPGQPVIQYDGRHFLSIHWIDESGNGHFSEIGVRYGRGENPSKNEVEGYWTPWQRIASRTSYSANGTWAPSYSWKGDKAKALTMKGTWTQRIGDNLNYVYFNETGAERGIHWGQETDELVYYTGRFDEETATALLTSPNSF